MDWPGLWRSSRVITCYSDWPDSSHQKRYPALLCLWGVGRVWERVWRRSQSLRTKEILLCLQLDTRITIITYDIFTKLSSFRGLLQKGQHLSLPSPRVPFYYGQYSFSHGAISMILKFSPMNSTFVSHMDTTCLASRHMKTQAGLICPNLPTQPSVTGWN